MNANLAPLATLAFAAIFFVWGKLRADLVALIALSVLALGGVLTTGVISDGGVNFHNVLLEAFPV